MIGWATSRWRGAVRGWLLCGVALALPAVGLPGAARAAAWSVRSVPSATGGGVRCVLQSERQTVFDGYQDTWAQILVDDSAVRVSSASVLDPGDGDLGLSVDGGPLVVADDVVDRRTAVFSTRYRELIEDFRRGLRVRVQLRFWPTWPKTGTHSVTFGLLGFTRAHARMPDCGTR